MPKKRRKSSKRVLVPASSERIRVVGYPRKEPDTKKLALALWDLAKEIRREEQGQPTRKAEAEARTATVSQLDREQDEAVEQLRALHKAEMDDVISELQAKRRRVIDVDQSEADELSSSGPDPS